MEQDDLATILSKDEEELTTISWTSSTVSLSPDNPLFHASSSQPKIKNNVSTLQADLEKALETTGTHPDLCGADRKVQTLTMAPDEEIHCKSAAQGETAEECQISASLDIGGVPAVTRTSSSQLQSLLFKEHSSVKGFNNLNHDNEIEYTVPVENLATTCSHPFKYPEDDEGEPLVDDIFLKSLTASHYEEDEEVDENPVMLEYEKELSEEDLLKASESKSFLPHFHHKSETRSVDSFATAGKKITESALFSIELPSQSTDSAMIGDLGEKVTEAPGNGNGFHFAFDTGTWKDDFEEEEEEDDVFESNSLLHVYHHGRQPSTILEEHSESLKKEEDELYQHHREEQQQAQPLLTKQVSPSRPNTTNRPLSEISKETRDSTVSFGSSNGGLRYNHNNATTTDPLEFTPFYTATRLLRLVSRKVLSSQHVPHAGAATWIAFWALLHVTCANYVLTPMRDAIALQVGVKHIPQLTLASTVLAVFSSVPIGWLFEAPDPGRRRLWKRMGLTRGETQGTSLALFYRFFAFILVSYAVGFQWLEWFRNHKNSEATEEEVVDFYFWFLNLTQIWASLSQIIYIAFFLVVHLMKLHCLSLVWGVTTEAMEYEEVARKQHQKTQKDVNFVPMESQKMRLKRLSLVGFGGTLGGIVGSFLASSMAQILRLPGLLLIAACMLEVSAELSIELGRIMQKHWEGQQQLFQSSNDLSSLDPSMQRSSSLGSMKRISSGNSLNRVKSTSDLGNKPLSAIGSSSNLSAMATSTSETVQEKVSDDTFSVRMIRGVTTILRSRLLMAIFTYNALYASTTVLLSFQRAALIASRNDSTTVQADTAFLANINMASSAAIFALQASGVGAFVAHRCGSRGTLALMPLIRLLGVLALAWWHRFSNGKAPNLIIFLVVDECCKIMNLAVAKPVRESLWRGLSNEARYEAKPIVDTLANRWGGGSAAFLVSFVDKTLDLFGGISQEPGGIRTVFGFPPVLFLCVFISAWWAVVSADLGQIRKSIDLELKKRQ